MGASDFQQELGERLRAIRQQQGLTLQQVEEKSDGEWKAVVVGSYERGDRAVSVSKLARLADFYAVPVRELLPEVDEQPARREGDAPRVIIDLTKLPSNGSADASLQPLARLVDSIRIQRGDYNGQMLTIRGDDVRALATLLGRDPNELIDELADRGVLVEVG